MERRRVLGLVGVGAAVVAVALVLLLARPFGWGSGDDVGPAAAAAGDPGVLVHETAARLTGTPDAAAAPDAVPYGFAPIGRLELALGSATLTGTVTGADAPLPGALVRLALEPRSTVAAVRTRPNGTWEIAGVPAGTFDVRAEAEGWRGRTETSPAVAEGATVEVPAIDLERAKELRNLLAVKVEDGVGRPVVGAKVLATTMLWALDLAMGPELSGERDSIDRRATTDERGEARFERLPPETYDVAVIAPGFRVDAQPRIVLGEDDTKHVLFRLAPGVSISGTLVSATGDPVEGGFVSGLHQPSYANAPTARTGADGTFVLDGLREGSYMLFAGHDEKGQVVANPVRAPSAGVRLQLGGTGDLDVRVTRADGKPVPRYGLRPWRSQPFGYTYSVQFAVDDPEGHKVLHLPPGTYHLTVQGEAGDVAADQTATVALGQTVSVAIVLPKSASVSGVVTDSEGNHVSGAEVYVRHGGFPPGATREEYTRSDAEGSFVLRGLPNESVGIHVEREGYAPAVLEVTPALEGQGKEITVRLEKGAVVRGVVRQDHAPLPDEQVNLFSGFDFFEARTTRTDADGAYAFPGVAAGTYTVSTGPLEAGSPGILRRDVPVPASGEVVVDLDQAAPGGQGVVQGTVRSGDQPVPHAAITVIDGRGWSQATHVEADEQGAFRATGVQPGPVTVVATTAQGTSTVKGDVAVADDGTPAQVDLLFAAGEVKGRIAGDHDAPVSGAWVQIELAGPGARPGQVRATVVSDQDGGFRARGLAEGTYRVRASGSGYGNLVTDPFALADGQALDLGTLHVPLGVALQGRVVDDAGAPVEDATIALVDASGRPIQVFSLITSGSDGRWRLSGLSPGRYVVKVEARGYAPASVAVDVDEGGGTADTRLRRGGAIAVRVLDASQHPLAGARVSLLDDRGQLVTHTLSLVSLTDPGVGRTDGEGRTALTDLAPGVYTLRTDLAGYVVSGDAPSVRVDPGGQAEVVVELTRGE